MRCPTLMMAKTDQRPIGKREADALTDGRKRASIILQIKLVSRKNTAFFKPMNIGGKNDPSPAITAIGSAGGFLRAEKRHWIPAMGTR